MRDFYQVTKYLPRLRRVSESMWRRMGSSCSSEKQLSPGKCSSAESRQMWTLNKVVSRKPKIRLSAKNLESGFYEVEIRLSAKK